MEREYPECRLLIEDLRNRYGDVDEIRIADFARRNGMDARAVRKKFDLPQNTHSVNVVFLAHRICEQVRR